MPDYWTCPVCDERLRCSCSSQECGFTHDIASHLTTHDCYCDPCGDPECECQGKRCQVCIAKNTKDFYG